MPGARSLFQSALMLLLALSLGCGAMESGSRLPEGSYLAGNAAALRRFLAGLEGMPGTRVGGVALGLSAKLAACEEIAGHAPEGGLPELLESLDCAALAEQPPELRALLRDADLVFALSLGEVLEERAEGGDPAPRLIGTARIQANSTVEIEAFIEGELGGGLGALLDPAEGGSGPYALSDEDTLVHLRLRPRGGLDITSLVPQGSQADQMFKLKSKLFSRTVLDGSVEVAIYMPGEGEQMPPFALALGVSMDSVAESAMQDFILDLEGRWPIRHTPTNFGNLRGACFFDLRLFAELAPCYAAGDGVTVVGWNPKSVEKALASRTSRAGADAASTRGEIVVDLDRFAEADARLGRAYGTAPLERAIDYGWSMLRVENRSTDGVPRLRIELRAKEGA